MSCAVPICVAIAIGISAALLFNVPGTVVRNVAFGIIAVIVGVPSILWCYGWWTTPPALRKAKREMRSFIRGHGIKARIFYFDRQPAPVIVVEAKNDKDGSRLRDDPAFGEQLRAILVSTGWPPNSKFLFEVKGTTWLTMGRLPGE